ncbi:MAG: hypothetical protein QG674_319 [Patescibacteria group bacterium]|jgi:hypothetical protein|nr:hypothetical protein [Patescibacteria group bacterium]
MKNTSYKLGNIFENLFMFISIVVVFVMFAMIIPLVKEEDDMWRDSTPTYNQTTPVIEIISSQNGFTKLSLNNSVFTVKSLETK